MTADLHLVTPIVAFGIVFAFAKIYGRPRQRTQHPAIVGIGSCMTDGLYADAERRAKAALSERFLSKEDRGLLLGLSGSAKAAQGRLDEGIDELERALPLVAPEFSRPMHGSLAVTHSLRGNLDEGQSALEKSRTTAGMHGRDSEILAEAVLLLRRGDPQRAAKVIQDTVPELERRNTVHQMKRYYLLLSLALSLSMSTREDAGLQDALSRVRGIGPVLAMTSHWPELRAFIETQAIK